MKTIVKKPYEAPEMCIMNLNAEQAILTLSGTTEDMTEEQGSWGN